MSSPPPAPSASLSPGSQPQLPLTTAPPATTTTALLQPPSPAVSGVSTAIPTMTNEQLTQSLLHFSQNLAALTSQMANMQTDLSAVKSSLVGSQAQPSLSALAATIAALSAPPLPALPATSTGAFALAVPSTGVPLHMINWPTSPSPLPSWAMAPLPSATAAYSTPITTAVSPIPTAVRAERPTPGALYSGVDGLFLQPARARRAGRRTGP